MTTATQIQEELDAWKDEQGEFYNTADGVHYSLWSWDKDVVKSFDIPSGTVTLVEDHGGGEGDGEERYIVIKVGDQFFEYRGYYSSWDGTEWNEALHEVEPYEVTVTKYRHK